MEPVNILIIHSYDYITFKSGKGSMARIRAACDLIASGIIPEDVLVMFPQGYQKKDPQKPQ